MDFQKHFWSLEILFQHLFSFLNCSDCKRFYKSYNVQLQELMPTLEDPKAAIQYLSTQQDYRQILQGIRSWTMGFSKSENKALCQDLADAPY